MATVSVLGMDLPILEKLGDGWYLVAYQNGPCFASEYEIAALEIKARREHSEDDELSGDESECEGDDLYGPPEQVRELGVRMYRELTWPLVQSQLLKDNPT